MAYQIEAIYMTLSRIQGHSYCKPFRCAFSYSCAADHKFSTDIACHVVPLPQLSSLYSLLSTQNFSLSRYMREFRS